MLLDLIYLMGLLEEQGWLDSHVAPKRKPPEGSVKESEPQQHNQDEDVPADVKGQTEDEMMNCKEPKIDAETIGDQQETFQAPQTSKLDAFALELRAVRVSYLLIGALKSLTVIFSCEKLSDLLQLPKHDPPVSLSSPLASPNPEQARARGKQWDESAELRSVLQYVVQSMVKWAVRPCPIKQSVSLADLERAQIMIYKGAASHLQEEKEQKGLLLVSGLEPQTDPRSKSSCTDVSHFVQWCDCFKAIFLACPCCYVLLQGVTKRSNTKECRYMLMITISTWCLPLLCSSCLAQNNL